MTEQEEPSKPSSQIIQKRLNTTVLDYDIVLIDFNKIMTWRIFKKKESCDLR